MEYTSEKESSIGKKLDLDGYISRFTSFMAREKPVAMEGDANLHYRYIKALENVEIPEPPAIQPIDDLLARLGKQAVLKLDEIFLFIKTIHYFNRLSALSLPHPVGEWISEIDIPDEISQLLPYFTDEGDLNPEMEPELYDIGEALRRNRESIRETLRGLTRSAKMKDYLVDTNIHLYSGEESLLVRGGFSSAIKASVIGRSSGGFFYIVPETISRLREREAELLSRKEALIWRYCRTFSATLHKWTRFLRFLDREYDRFDHYQARVRFARYNDYEFVLPDSRKRVVLKEFAHPAIERCVPVDIEIVKPITLITGVNAGGKTMLLKSILSAIYMGKHLLPFRCDSSSTKIGRFKSIEAIIDDPQSVKNDISTFAGRMLQFSALFRKRDSIVGVDEIELGTDADEAASLFRTLLEELIRRDIFFVVTTHHKRLASLMAGEDSVDLVAALYDEERRVPTYTYLKGSIGKSYAFETAERYGIPHHIVERAKVLYGEDRERLNELIESSTRLEREMRDKIARLDREIESLKRKEKSLDEKRERMDEERRKMVATLENRYNAATKRALAALKKAESAEARRLLNEAHRFKNSVSSHNTEKSIPDLKVGQSVKYRSHTAEILSLKKDEALISADGIKMRVPLSQLKPVTAQTKGKKRVSTPQIKVEKSDRASLHIKLLGMRADEAIDALDDFLSNALMHGLEEVEVIHGTGGGVLSKVVSEHLKRHPRVKKFYRMPGNMGVTVVEL